MAFLPSSLSLLLPGYVIEVPLVQHLSHKWKQIRDCYYHLLWGGSPLQRLDLFWNLIEFSTRYSTAFRCTPCWSWAVEVSSSYLGQRVISDYAPEECWILFLVSIALNFALKYWSGVTNILITSLKRLTALSLNELEWVQGKNLQFQAPSLCHFPNILCTILRCSSELYVTYFSKLQLNSVFYYLTTVVHWTCSGLHLDIVLSSYSKPSSLLFLQFYLLHLILASEGRVAKW